MERIRSESPRRIDQRFAAASVVIVALVLFILIWVGIRQSRADSLELLIREGKVLTESLARAAQNAIVAESFYDYLIHLRFAPITDQLAAAKLETLTDDRLAELAVQYGLQGLFVIGADSTLVAGAIVAGPRVALPEFVLAEARQLLADPESHYLLLLEDEEEPGQAVHYYLEIANTLDRVVLVMADALYYVDALEQTQIGYLAQDMAREPDVEYVLYQTPEGIIFSSRATGPLLAIESDTFLTSALEGDTIVHRLYTFQGTEVLELVRPFSSARYPFGLFRVALSLDGYYAVTLGFDRQMIILGAALFILTVVALLYLNARRKRREIARRYSAMKSVTDKIFDEMRTGVAVVGDGGRISLANSAFARILGLRHPVGAQWNETLPAALALERLEPGQELSRETEVSLTVQGTDKTLLLATSKIHDEGEGAGGLVAVVYDITRLKEYERKSARRQRLSEMGNLAAGVAHEIRNPLNTISIASQRLETEFADQIDSAEYRVITGQIRSETRRLNEIITRFLALAREEQMRRETINLSGFLSEMVDFVRPEADRLHIDVSLDVNQTVPVNADRNSLKQVFINLFNNAKEALDGKPGRIVIAAVPADGSVLITFEDSGPGIPPELREKIFAPYFTTKESGTGLGLPTVHRIVSEMDGDVRVEDGDSGGARIVISVPARQS